MCKLQCYNPISPVIKKTKIDTIAMSHIVPRIDNNDFSARAKKIRKELMAFCLHIHHSDLRIEVNTQTTDVAYIFDDDSSWSETKDLIRGTKFFLNK